ncbi:MULTISPECIES: alpha/beta fold hydrolase [Lysobacter]|uniref:Alpha/beta hydrolase n=1 Tax=Lysobacter firmicutimachus TaxID=1792846 RepID=A0ABU8CX76_9GAMM|nr:alpha/beta hydrolase [Lysobacter antibioticus]
MNRRTFLGFGLGAAGTGLLAACAGGAPVRAPASLSTAKAWDAAGFHAARRYLPSAFGEIAVVERGRGPAALFLHGFPLNSFQWRGVMAALEGERRCIAADFLGLGYTRVADGQSVAPAAQVEMLAFVLDTLGVDSVDLVANDSGGAVAQLFLLKYPQRVRSLLLTNCDVEPDSPPPALMPVIEAARRGRFAEDTFPPQLADKNFARSAKGIGGQCYTYRYQPSDEAIDTYFTPLVESARRKRLTDAYALALDPNPLAGIEAGLRRSRVPVRVVWGTGDDIFSPASPDYLDRVFPNSRGVRRVEGAKLFYPEEFPQLVAEEASRLWESV